MAGRRALIDSNTIVRDVWLCGVSLRAHGSGFRVQDDVALLVPK